uniref:Uncharacterized protein n=1 Tax=Siphoviridae sp. cttFh17 TaxID=2826491 RepID=A0A8S5NJE8_9CAUD|nr:MAG TPA: hypothetical protein [Siphoviridae sp. cttFh17]
MLLFLLATQKRHHYDVSCQNYFTLRDIKSLDHIYRILCYASLRYLSRHF